MGVLSTYGELKAALADYTARSANPTWAANTPVFVMRAHSVIMRELRIPLLTASTDLTIAAETVTPPSGFRAVVRLFLSDAPETVLRPASPEQRAIEAASWPAARPRLFALEGTSLVFGPVPDTSYTGKLLYAKALDFFASDGDTNAVLTRHPFLYLYGALAEAARFDKADEDIALYEGMFSSELNAVQIAEQLDATGGGTMVPTVSGAVI